MAANASCRSAQTSSTRVTPRLDRACPAVFRLGISVLGHPFPRRSRLVQTSEFRQVREHGTAYHSKLLILSVLTAAPDHQLRTGLITSGRVGNAVERNRLRRRLREIFRLHQARLAPGVWIVTIARKTAVAASWERLQSDWLQLARRASILTADEKPTQPAAPDARPV